ncbi:hypothetical protein ABT023_07630 [Micromonospora sp. NPDC002296]|uniref:hypothetical protein n=1 Tax=Micromonospora sp. NPDC002296 TaxID=3154271 RepID=UPI003330C57F
MFVGDGTRLVGDATRLVGDNARFVGGDTHLGGGTHLGGSDVRFVHPDLRLNGSDQRPVDVDETVDVRAVGVHPGAVGGHADGGSIVEVHGAAGVPGSGQRTGRRLRAADDGIRPVVVRPVDVRRAGVRLCGVCIDWARSRLDRRLRGGLDRRQRLRDHRQRVGRRRVGLRPARNRPCFRALGGAVVLGSQGRRQLARVRRPDTGVRLRGLGRRAGHDGCPGGDRKATCRGGRNRPGNLHRYGLVGHRVHRARRCRCAGGRG